MNKRKLLPPAGALYSSRPNRPVQYITESPEKKTKYPGMAMSVEDMAEELAIGRNVAYQLVQQPDFPSFMIGRRVLVSRKGCRNGSTNNAKRALKPPRSRRHQSPENLEKYKFVPLVLHNAIQ